VNSPQSRIIHDSRCLSGLARYNAWAKLKERIYILYPDPELLMGLEQLKVLLYMAMDDAWGREFRTGIF